jgi:hypothetical protein
VELRPVERTWAAPVLPAAPAGRVPMQAGRWAAGDSVEWRERASGEREREARVPVRETQVPAEKAAQEAVAAVRPRPARS